MDILTLLGSYCFPIVACIGMAIYVERMTKQNREDTKELNMQHSKEMRRIQRRNKGSSKQQYDSLNKAMRKARN